MLYFDYVIEIKGKIKSRDLYKRLEKYKANVTDIIFLTFVYGEASLTEFLEIILICSKYGHIKVQFTRR